MFATKLDCQLFPVLMFCSCSCPLCEQGAGWLLEIILNMILIWLKIVDSLPMWSFMTCDVNDGVLLFWLWQHWVCAHLLNQRMNRIEQDWTGIVLLAMAISALLGQFQLESGYQVLSPRCRWDLCQAKLHQRWRRDSNLRVIGQEAWRCCAQEFLWSLSKFWDGCRLW